MLSAVVVALADPLKVTVAPAPVLLSVPEMTAVTVRTKPFDVIPFWDAVTLVDPMAMAVATPVELIEALAGSELAQLAVLVRSCVLPSLKMPVAVNCSVNPMVSEVLGAVTLMDWSIGFLLQITFLHASIETVRSSLGWHICVTLELLATTSTAKQQQRHPIR